MLYYNTKFRFALPEGSPESIAGGIIAASAMPAGQLVRRMRAGLRAYPHLQHRMFDPQLYLAGLDRDVAPKTIAKLATQKWFGSHEVPEYDSDKHGSMKAYKDRHQADLVESWRRSAPTRDSEIEVAVRECIQFQLRLGCEAIILPSPLTTNAADAYELELRYLEAGLSAARELRSATPLLATVALSDSVLRGMRPFKNALVNSIAAQIAARNEIAGVYIVLEQTVDSGYVCNARDVLASLLVLTDDLSRGAGKRVVANYLGTFGAVLCAAGAETWATGYYRSQRRLRLADYEENVAMAMPRFFSFGMAGDVGLEKHLQDAFANGFGKEVIEPISSQSASLQIALSDGTYPQSVPQWAYKQSNLTAAAAHYLEVNMQLGAMLDSRDASMRVDVVKRWLTRADMIAKRMSALHLGAPYTDSGHQGVWLGALEDWISGRP